MRSIEQTVSVNIDRWQASRWTPARQRRGAVDYRCKRTLHSVGAPSYAGQTAAGDCPDGQRTSSGTPLVHAASRNIADGLTYETPASREINLGLSADGRHGGGWLQKNDNSTGYRMASALPLPSTDVRPAQANDPNERACIDPNPTNPYHGVHAVGTDILVAPGRPHALRLLGMVRI